MKYECGTEVLLEDEILVQYGPESESLARVVAIGLNKVANNIDTNYYEWVKTEALINETTVIIEWLGNNPLATSDSNSDSVSSYMILESLCCEKFVRRQK